MEGNYIYYLRVGHILCFKHILLKNGSDGKDLGGKIFPIFKVWV